MNNDHSNQNSYGTIARWQDDKGFGFIMNRANGEEIFFHISQYKGSSRPHLGERVIFKIERGSNGKLQAVRVQQESFVLEQQRRRRQYKQQQEAFDSKRKWHSFIALLPILVLLMGYLLGNKPLSLLVWYLVLSVLTFLFYYKDKSAAQNGSWRTPENTLHLLSLAGGWGGAMLAQTWLRHKSQKKEFRFTYWITVGLNLIGLVWLLTSSKGKMLLNYFSNLL